MASDGKLPGRRWFLLSGVGIAALRTASASTAKHIHRFTTDYCDIRISVEFHDRYSSDGLLFNNVAGPLCLLLNGVEDANCAGRFVGSLAIARYEIRSRSRRRHVSTLREYVRNIDRDEQLEPRPPFRREVKLHHGVATDVQAFGYTDTGSAATPVEAPAAAQPWHYFRQDLYLDRESAPFLIIHWKHTLSAIRMLDMIPAGGTSVVNR